MPTTIPEHVVIQSIDVGDGCENFNIFAAPTSSGDTAIATITREQLVEGYKVSGSDMVNAYLLQCLDTNDVVRSTETILNCVDGTVLPDAVCPEPVQFAGGVVFPAYYTVDLGTELGEVTMNFEAYNVPDKFIINWSGSTVANTGYRGSQGQQNNLDIALASQNVAPENIVGQGGGTVSFYKNTAYPNTATVEVYAPLSSTAWVVTVECPDGVVDSDNDGPIGSCVDIPSNGGSCLTGTTFVRELEDYPIASSDEQFTLLEGSTALVKPQLTVTNGYTYPSASAELYDSSLNLVRRFIMRQEQGEEEPSYYPSSYEIRTPGTYTLRAYSHPTANGGGCVSLYVGSCSPLPNQDINGANAIKTSSSGATFTGLKIILQGTGFSQQSQAQDIVEFLTNRTVGANTSYNFSDDMQWRGFKVIDEDENSTVGDVSVTSASSIYYEVQGTDTIVQMNAISGTGTLSTVQTGITDLTLRQKN